MKNHNQLAKIIPPWRSIFTIKPLNIILKNLLETKRFTNKIIHFPYLEDKSFFKGERNFKYIVSKLINNKLKYNKDNNK
jgi:hypothetical protein